MTCAAGSPPASSPPAASCRASPSSARDYAASRMTVRRALEVLRDEGLVDSRQGFGWFVGGRPAAPVARPARHHRGAAGRVGPALGAPGARVRLRHRPGDGSPPCWAPGRVLEVRRLNLVDGVPWARVTVWCPADLASHLSLADVERTTFHELLEVELGWRHPDHRRRAPCRRPTPRCWRARRIARAGVRTGDAIGGRRRRAAGRARLPGPPHPVRRRARERRPLGGAQRVATRQVAGLRAVRGECPPDEASGTVSVAGRDRRRGRGQRGHGVRAVGPRLQPARGHDLAQRAHHGVVGVLRAPQHREPHGLRPELLRHLRPHRRPRRRHGRPRDRASSQAGALDGALRLAPRRRRQR